jgi:hypothetical protein
LPSAGAVARNAAGAAPLANCYEDRLKGNEARGAIGIGKLESGGDVKPSATDFAALTLAEAASRLNLYTKTRSKFLKDNARRQPLYGRRGRRFPYRQLTSNTSKRR